MKTQTQSHWMATFQPRKMQPLLSDQTADVCVVGAGITGLTCAYLLARDGKSVIVLDMDEVGSGESGRTTAQFSTSLDKRYMHIRKMHGLEATKRIASGHAKAINLAEHICKVEDIDCDMVRLAGYLVCGSGHDSKYMKEEFHCAKAVNIEVDFIEHSPLHAFGKLPMIRFANQMQLHPTKYLDGLAAAVLRHRGHVYVNSRVTSVETSKKITKIRVESGATVSAEFLVDATHTPVIDRFVMHTKQAAYRTYVISCEIPKSSVPLALYWDTENPYHYVRIDASNDKYDTLIVGGCDHKVGQLRKTPDQLTLLERWTRSNFPMIRAVRSRWSGQVFEPVDSFGYAGRNPMGHANHYIITGHSGNGMTHGTLGAHIVADSILKNTVVNGKIFKPNRKSFKAIAQFVRENSNSFAQYADWLKIRPYTALSDLQRGQAKVVNEGFSKVGIFRDQSGVAHQCSMKCPHLGAVLRWNALEKTWDCPAHGSRFDCDGRVLCGPAFANLTGQQKLIGSIQKEEEKNDELKAG